MDSDLQPPPEKLNEEEKAKYLFLGMGCGTIIVTIMNLNAYLSNYSVTTLGTPLTDSSFFSILTQAIPQIVDTTKANQAFINMQPPASMVAISMVFCVVGVLFMLIPTIAKYIVHPFINMITKK
jgi:uncharacterized protein YjeT (DUF2065 family)